MSVEVVVFNALGSLSGDIEYEIRAGIEDGISAFGCHTRVEHVGIAVHPYGYVSEFTGIGGINYGPESFSLFVDDAYAGLRVETRRHAAAATVHELHHTLRQRGCSLKPLHHSDNLCAGDVLILEGLAIQCEHFLGFGPSWNVHDVSHETACSLIDRIAPVIADPKADWNWIYDLNGLPAPIYKAMYPMGYHIVAEYLREHRCNPIEAMHVPWQKFWEAYGKRCPSQGS